MPFESRELTLRGVLSVEGTQTSPGSKFCNPAVKLHFYEVLESAGRDSTFYELRQAVPYSPGYALPYSVAKSAADRDLGLRGTAKLALPAARGARGKARKARVLAEATEIARFEIEPAGDSDSPERLPGMAEAEVKVRTRRWQLANGSGGVALDIVEMRPLFVHT